ncbi:uncharacterized protein METZ01_LOCUS364574, partial [marine metagenome]
MEIVMAGSKKADLAKDMRILLKLLRKLGKKVADEGTFMERKTK